MQAKRLRLSDIIQIGENTEEETDEENRQQQNNEYHLHQKSRVTQENKPAENGIIESITCTNFMCHSFVHVEIGPLINWVIGHNGSGKSAILTALTVCLGGKASATNRAGSLRAFVKEGTEYVSLCM
jgi:ABC-type molybdenum transport system ATPase subunit/photorepair protein PhrA